MSRLEALANDELNMDKLMELFCNPLANDKLKTLQNWKTLQTTISNLMKMADSFLKG